MQRFIVVIGFLLALGPGDRADGYASPQRCRSDKLKATAAQIGAQAKCYAKAIGAGQSVDAACLNGAQAKLEAKFVRIDANGSCVVIGDAGVYADRAIAYVDSVVSATTGDSKCVVAKIKASGKAAAKLLKMAAKGGLNASYELPYFEALLLSRFDDQINAADRIGTCTGASFELTTGISACARELANTPDNCLDDLGDGTIQDHCTGLQWERKRPDAGLHDANAVYPWAGCCGGDCSVLCQPDAAAKATCLANATSGTFGCDTCAVGVCEIAGASTTAWGWIATLNAGAFGGHVDWRLPSAGEIIDLERCPLVPPCIDAAFTSATVFMTGSSTTSQFGAESLRARWFGIQGAQFTEHVFKRVPLIYWAVR